MTDPLRPQFGIFVQGFEGAYVRLVRELEHVETPPEIVFAPLFEALNWATVLRRVAHNRGSGPDQRAIKTLLDDLLALEFARDRCHHQWQNALVVKDVPWPAWATATRFGPRLIQPRLLPAWVWRDAAEFSPGSKRHGAGASEYGQLLAGQHARFVLDRVSAVLALLR
jgi:hypothetical protein